LPLIEQWSENDAKKMAKNKYREQYLANENYFTHNNEQSSSEIVLGPLVDYSKGKFNQFEI
jgi:hypothetical protein